MTRLRVRIWELLADILQNWELDYGNYLQIYNKIESKIMGITCRYMTRFKVRLWELLADIWQDWE